MMRFAIANQTLLQWPVCSNCGRTHVVWLVSGMDQRQSARIFSPFNNFVQIELLLEVKSNRSSRSSRNCYDECFPIHLLRSLIRSSLHNDGGQCIECVECIECVAFSTFKCNSTTERMLITCFCLSPVQANWRRGRFLLFARRKSCSEWDEALRVTMKRAVLPIIRSWSLFIFHNFSSFWIQYSGQIECLNIYLMRILNPKYESILRFSRVPHFMLRTIESIVEIELHLKMYQLEKFPTEMFIHSGILVSGFGNKTECKSDHKMMRFSIYKRTFLRLLLIWIIQRLHWVQRIQMLTKKKCGRIIRPNHKI